MSGPGTNICAFPEVTQKEALLIKSASRQKNKGLGQREETCTWQSSNCRQKAGEVVDKIPALWIITAVLCAFKGLGFFSWFFFFTSPGSGHFGEKWIKCCCFSSKKTQWQVKTSQCWPWVLELSAWQRKLPCIRLTWASCFPHWLLLQLVWKPVGFMLLEYMVYLAILTDP